MMSDPRRLGGSDKDEFEQSSAGDPAQEKQPGSDIEKLRLLLLQDTVARLETLERRLDDPLGYAREVGEVLAEAVAIRSGKDQMLSKALEPIVENSVRESLRKRPHEFINVFFPLIGSTIRRSISETFSSMLGNFSKSLEKSFSLKGLRWRIEAFRTGKSFSEIVMLHTLIYSVDQIYLIHSETGLVLSHRVNDGINSKDADMISGMLTAIQDFARDCFNNEGDDSTLNSLKMDEYTIFIERSPLAYVACVVRGMPPAGFQNKLRESLELVLVENHEALIAFNGDSAPFIASERYLEDCLDSKFVDDDKKPSLFIKALPIVFLAILLAGFGFKQYHTFTMKKQVNAFISEPGFLLVSTKSFWSIKPWEIVLLRDDMATPEDEVLSRKGFSGIKVGTIPFVSHEPEIVKRRVESKIRPPDTVTVVFKDGALTLSGSADMNWILDARQAALITPGVVSLDMSGLQDLRFATLQDMVHEIEATTVRFATGKDIPIPEDAGKLRDVVYKLVELEKLAQSMGLSVNLTVYGHADAVGSDRINYKISQERAETIAAMLYANKSGIPVSIYGMGADYAEIGEKSKEDRNSRKIELRVRIVQAVSADQLLRPSGNIF